ncbi:MAG: NAD(P)-dependent alcohol dehydrogenase [Smithellaceae bacterium]
MKIKAWTLEQANADLKLEELDLDDPKHGEVLIKVVASGICHTDISGISNSFGLNQYPVVLGHEGGGIIEKLGPGVQGYEVGDHVLMSYPYCGTCHTCLSGHPYVCENGIPLQYNGVMVGDLTGRLHRNGKPMKNFFGQSSWATYAVMDTRQLVKVDKSLDLKMFAPLGCGALTGAGTVLNFWKCATGDTIAIIGAGGVGLSAMMAAKASNSKKIVMIDVVKSRLDLALSLGATDVINPKEVPDITAKLMEITGGKGLNYVIETSGHTDVFNAVSAALTVRGEAGLIAPYMTPTEVGNLFFYLYRRTLHCIVLGMTTAEDIIPKMLELNKRGLFPYEKLVKHYKFEDINKAIADMHSGATVKPVLVMP